MAKEADATVRPDSNNPILETGMEAPSRPSLVCLRIRNMNGKERRHAELMAKLEEIVRLLQLTRSPLNRQEQPFNLQRQYTQEPLSPTKYGEPPYQVPRSPIKGEVPVEPAHVRGLPVNPPLGEKLPVSDDPA